MLQVSLQPSSSLPHNSHNFWHFWSFKQSSLRNMFADSDRNILKYVDTWKAGTICQNDFFRNLPAVEIFLKAEGSKTKSLMSSIQNPYCKIFQTLCRQSKTGKASLALRKGRPRRATAQDFLFQVMHVRIHCSGAVASEVPACCTRKLG